jgi:hypothetical protein
MPDSDSADRLAKAIEEMVQGRTPEDIGDEDIQELIQIAMIRLDAARQAAETCGEAKSAVLDRLLARLNLLNGQEQDEPNGATSVNDLTGESAPANAEPENVDVKELQDVIDLRRQIAEHAVAISESHRDAVWQRVQARIQAEQSAKRGFFPWPFRHRDHEAAEFGAALDHAILGEPIWEAKDSNLEELLRLAQIRQAAALTTRAAFADQQARVWARLRPRLMARLIPSSRIFRRRLATPWPKLAAAGAAVALVTAALGPIPATGLAHHPATEFVRFLGSYVGVSETSTSPTVPPVTEVIEGDVVSADAASALIGLPVHEPTFMPAGYEQVSVRYFPEPLTAVDGGLFVLAYENPGLTGNPSTILVYQERSSLNNIVVAQGFAQDVRLSTGNAATYVSGTWRPLGNELTWGENGAQTILFDAAGVRTIIYTTDGDLALANLLTIAESLATQAGTP